MKICKFRKAATRENILETFEFYSQYWLLEKNMSSVFLPLKHCRIQQAGQTNQNEQHARFQFGWKWYGGIAWNVKKGYVL